MLIVEAKIVFTKANEELIYSRVKMPKCCIYANGKMLVQVFAVCSLVQVSQNNNNSNNVGHIMLLFFPHAFVCNFVSLNLQYFVLFSSFTAKINNSMEYNEA